MNVTTHNTYGDQWLTVFQTDKAVHKFVSNDGMSMRKIIGYTTKIFIGWIKATAGDIKKVLLRGL